MWQQQTEGRSRWAIRRLLAAYLAIAALALLFPHRPSTWLLLLVLHAFAVILLLQVGRRPLLRNWVQARWPRLTKVLADWYALALIPALYAELAVLNDAVHGGRYFDETILSWEAALFGGQPSRELAAQLPSLPLSELLHFSYLSYYLIIYGPPLYLYLRGRVREQQTVVFVLMLTFVVHYVFFIYFPVQGPRYVFEAPGGELARGWFYQFAHTLLEAGSSRGAAFPSSHVGVAFAQTALAFLLLPRAAPLLLVFSTGLAVGAVYGGFHYAIDALCGLLLGLLVFLSAPKVARALTGHDRT